jgi:hypothetical protein
MAFHLLLEFGFIFYQGVFMKIGIACLFTLVGFIVGTSARAHDLTLKSGLYAPDAGHESEGCNLEVTAAGDPKQPNDINVKTAAIQSNPTCVVSKSAVLWSYVPGYDWLPAAYGPGRIYPDGICFEILPSSETEFIKWGLIVDQSVHIPYHRVGDN